MNVDLPPRLALWSATLSQGAEQGSGPQTLAHHAATRVNSHTYGHSVPAVFHVQYSIW